MVATVRKPIGWMVGVVLGLFALLGVLDSFFNEDTNQTTAAEVSAVAEVSDNCYTNLT